MHRDCLIGELPPPLCVPLGWASGPLAAMRPAERRLAQEFLGGQAVYFAACTGSRADVGRWLGPRRIWALALRGELALVAHGPRPFTERIPFSLLGESTYNAVTGELVLAPGPDHRGRGLRLQPLEGYQMLAQIHREDDGDAPTAG